MLIRLEVADKYSRAAFPKPFPTVPETAGRKAAQTRLHVLNGRTPYLHQAMLFSIFHFVYSSFKSNA